jgi:hypothetical protein
MVCLDTKHCIPLLNVETSLSLNHIHSDERNSQDEFFTARDWIQSDTYCNLDTFSNKNISLNLQVDQNANTPTSKSTKIKTTKATLNIIQENMCWKTMTDRNTASTEDNSSSKENSSLCN